MCKIIYRSLSIILVLTLVVQLLPLSCFAADAAESGEPIFETTTPEAEQLVPSEEPTEEESTEEEKETPPPQIVEEDLRKRDEYYKEFLLDNGQRLATVYPTAVHYQKDGQWAEIDNTLTLTGTAYTNTAGPWSVQFPQRLSGSNAISITKDGYTVSFSMSGELTSGGGLAVASIDATATAELSVATAKTSTAQLQSVDTTSLKASAQFPETVPDKLHGRLMYPAVYDNTNVVYDLDGTRLKESIILPAYDAALYGYRYTLNTGGLTATLNDDQSISLCDPDTGTVVLSMPAPFLVDDDGEYSYDVQVVLTQKGTSYLLSYYIPQTWLSAEERTWPVVLDPIINAGVDDNIEDIAVAELYSLSKEAGVLECGYANNWGKMRTYMRFVNLPQLSAADVIVKALIQMTVYEGGNTTDVEVRKIASTWSLDSITWANQPTYNSIIEDIVSISSNTSSNYSWDITDIARAWYADTSHNLSNNTGMVFKATDSIESGGVVNWKQFRSGNSSSNNPYLTIQYQHASGLEDYWDYTSSSAGRAGTGYVQNFSGNLVWVHEDMGFDGNRMPVSIQHIYNSSDAVVDENNIFGLGIGWRTNYNQTLSKVTDETIESYYVWIDGDGTKRYFNPDTVKPDGTILYSSVDTQGLTLYVSENSWVIMDRLGNASHFDSHGRLFKMENNQKTKSNIQIHYVGNTLYIDYIIDGAGRYYVFEYENGLLSKIGFAGKQTSRDGIAPGDLIYDLEYQYSTTGLLTSITYPDNESTSFGYTSANLLLRVANIDGAYVRYTYQTAAAGKWGRVYQIREYDNDTMAARWTFSYRYGQTKISRRPTDVSTDDYFLVYQFNEWGNTLSASDDKGHSQVMEYDPATRNSLTMESQDQYTVVNLLSDYSFEKGTVWSATAYANSASIEEPPESTDVDMPLLGTKSMLVSVGTISSNCGASSNSFTLSAGKSICFSAFVYCTDGSMHLEIANSSTVFSTSDNSAKEGDGWVWLEVAYTNTSTASQTIQARVTTESPNSSAYVDCVQLEYASTASRFNYVEQADFNKIDSFWDFTSGVGTSAGIFHPALNANRLSITGSLSQARFASQTINLSGQAGDRYVAAGWVLGDAIHMTSPSQNLGLRVIFQKNGSRVSSSVISANENNSGSEWQYIAGEAVAKGEYDSIVICCEYLYGLNTVYFDGIQLYKEPLGTKYEYNSSGNVTKSTDILGKETTYTYFSNNADLKTVTPPTGPRTVYSYDNNHNVITSEDYAKDANGSEFKKTTTTFTYNTYGNLTSTTISNGTITQTSSTEYTNDGNQIKSITNAEGKTTSYSYNANTGLLEWVQEPKDTESTRTVHEYDSMFRLTRVSEGKITSDTTEMQVTYTYTDDELAQISNNTQSYYLTYENFGLLSGVRVGNRQLASYQYSSDGKNLMVQLDYGNDFGIKYTYDNEDRITVKTYTSAGGTITDNWISYTFTNRGELALMTDNLSGIIVKYKYDSLGRLINYYETGGGRSYHEVSYHYNDLGNLGTREETIGNETRTTVYEYDTLNRLSKTTSYIESLTAEKTCTGYVVYSYDSLDRVIQQRNQVEDCTSVVVRNTTYNSHSNQVATVRNYSNAGDYQTTYTYTYDDNGNILSVSDGTYTTSYRYNGANQLIREYNQRAGKIWTWKYNDAGNLTHHREYNYSDTGMDTPLYTMRYTYGDANWGDLLTAYDGVAITYDEIGNPLNDGTWSYTWERGRQLKSMSNGSTTWNMTYDADGMRTSRIAGSNKYYYYYHDGLLTYMKYNSLVMRFTYDAQGRPVSMTYNGNTYYYALNLQGDVMALLDANGNEVVSYHYNAWGEIISTTASTTGMLNTLAKYNPLRYRSYVYDRETGLYYLQSRYYNPEIGRFINADDLSNLGIDGTIISYNMFAYCGNNPVVYADSYGESFSIVLGFNFNIFGWGVIGTINIVFTEEDFGIQYSYYFSDDGELSQKENDTVGVDIGPYVGIQYTEKTSMDGLEGLAKATGGDLLLGGDILSDENGKYMGWQLGTSCFSANMHSLYTNTETLFSVPTINVPRIIVNWVFGGE